MADNTVTLSLWDVAEYLDLRNLEVVKVLAINGKHHVYTRQKKATLGDIPTSLKRRDMDTANTKRIGNE